MQLKLLCEISIFLEKEIISLEVVAAFYLIPYNNNKNQYFYQFDIL